MQTLAALAAFQSKLKAAWESRESSPPPTGESDGTVKQSDLLATTRNDVVDDDDDDNDDDGWMGHQVKFVRHFEVAKRREKDSLRDGSFEPSVDLYVTEDPLKQDPVGCLG